MLVMLALLETTRGRSICRGITVLSDEQSLAALSLEGNSVSDHLWTMVMRNQTFQGILLGYPYP
jgi:hypothetical protein